MSTYGPPGGPYPGQPQDPWQGGQPHDPYGQPEPWGAPTSGAGGAPPPYNQPPQYDPGHAQPTYNQPTYNQPGYGQQPGYGGDVWGAPTPPPKKGKGLLITIIAVLLVLVCGAGGTVAFFAFKGAKKVADVAASSNPTATPTPTSSTAKSPTATSTPTETATTDTGRNIKAGDCLVNDGTSDSPKLRKVPCAANTFEVLQRFDGTADKGKCTTVAGSTASYFYDSPVNSLDYVLCMKQR
jgi:hypothetical protein